MRHSFIVRFDGSFRAQQGCQMVYFRTKKFNLGKFLQGFLWKMMAYFMAIWSILQPFGMFHGNLVHFLVICYIFSRFGMLYQEKSGTPGFERRLNGAAEILVLLPDAC
jgi:hypothetical protein